MRTTSFAGMTCSIASAVEAVGDRWGFLVLRDVMLGLSRYEELRRSTGIPAQTLADRLRHLERNQLIERRPYESKPRRDRYVVTGRGRDLWIAFVALRDWGDSWGMYGADGPPLRLVHRETGRPLDARVVDPSTGEIVAPEDTSLEAGPGADEVMRWRLAVRAAR